MTRKSRIAHYWVVLKAIIATIALVVLLSGFQGSMLHPGHPDLQDWLLPHQPPAPSDNRTNPQRVALGKMLFFDPRLSGDGSLSCASCHNPATGWSDGLKTSVRQSGSAFRRATPSIVNTGYNSLYMWDGRFRSLEQQAIAPMVSSVEMAGNLEAIVSWLENTPGYRDAFRAAYPEEGISVNTLAKAIAAFERSIVSNTSPFDRWISGEEKALSDQQVQGFEIFMREDKGNCAVCHSAPNFTDDSFHNIGLKTPDSNYPDFGRYQLIPIAVLKGAFKTPTLRDVELTAPYFHDGSAGTLEEVVDFYVKGGGAVENLSPEMKPLYLTDSEKHNLVAFLKSLTSPSEPVAAPLLPFSFTTPSLHNRNSLWADSIGALHDE